MARFYWALSGVALFVSATLLIYSQTAAFAWDEGFHLLAAQLIAAGKRPYLDFFFPQVPLNAYWNAACLRLLGQGWRIPHAVAALEVSAAVVLACESVYRLIPEPRWRLPATFFVASAFGLNVAVVQFGPLAQAYGLCLLLIVAAFRVSLAAVGRRSAWLSLMAGFLAAAAAESSLLTAPVAPVLLIWIIAANRAGSRLVKLGGFVLGGLIASIPLLWLFAQSPEHVWFGVVKFHLFYRGVAWPGALSHDLGVALAWVDCGQALVLAVLAGTGFAFVRRSAWGQPAKSAIYLCGWLALAETIHLLTAHPTFNRYFAFIVPFLAIPAAAGLCALGEKFGGHGRVRTAAAVACCFMALGLFRRLHEDAGDFRWKDAEEMAAKVNEVTAPGAPLYAEENVYFLTHRMLPGMENHDSHKLSLTPAESARLHILTRTDVDGMIKAGAFSTAQSCDDEEIKRLDGAKIYGNKTEMSGCAVFWGKIANRPAGK